MRGRRRLWPCIINWVGKPRKTRLSLDDMLKQARRLAIHLAFIGSGICWFQELMVKKIPIPVTSCRQLRLIRFYNWGIRMPASPRKQFCVNFSPFRTSLTKGRIKFRPAPPPRPLTSLRFPPPLWGGTKGGGTASPVFSLNPRNRPPAPPHKGEGNPIARKPRESNFCVIFSPFRINLAEGRMTFHLVAARLPQWRHGLMNS